MVLRFRADDEGLSLHRRQALFFITRTTKTMKPAILVFGITLCCIVVRVNATDASVHNGPIKQNATLNIPDSESIVAINPRRTPSQDFLTDTYENEVRQLNVQREEPASLSDAPRDPDLVTGITLVSEESEPDLLQLEEIKQVLSVKDQQIAQTNLPEPEPAESKKESTFGQHMFQFSGEISVIDDDNVRSSQNNDDILDDTIVSAAVKVKGEKAIDSLTTWDYGGSLTYNSYDTYDDLNNYEFEANTHYRFALTSGLTAPIYSLGARIGGIDSDSEMRDATVYSLSAELSKWLSTTINMTAGLGYSKQDSVSKVFDTSESHIFINFDAEVSRADLVYTTLTLMTGDKVSGATPTLDIVNVADEIEPDDAFGGVADNQFAYRIDADSVVVALGYNRILTQGLSFDVSARYIYSEARDDRDISYERTILKASLVGSF